MPPNAVALFTHPDCLDHDTGPSHPECADRLRAVLRALAHPDFAALRRHKAMPATVAQLRLAHPQAHIDRILGTLPIPGERTMLDPDTAMSAGSARAALLAAGAACGAMDAVMQGECRAAFAATRPPGHHAEAAQPMGFCLFANAAIAARHARARWGLERVAIVDFDVHHGNGTQAIVGDDPGAFFASSHQSPCYPGAGRADERGMHGGVHNLPLPPGTDGAAFRRGWADILLPALDAFAPELLIVSAGFDGHRADPLAAWNLEAADFAWLTGELARIAARHAGGRIVSLLEGGYDLVALAESAAAHLRALMDA